MATTAPTTEHKTDSTAVGTATTGVATESSAAHENLTGNYRAPQCLADVADLSSDVKSLSHNNVTKFNTSCHALVSSLLTKYIRAGKQNDNLDDTVTVHLLSVVTDLEVDKQDIKVETASEATLSRRSAYVTEYLNLTREDLSTLEDGDIRNITSLKWLTDYLRLPVSFLEGLTVAEKRSLYKNMSALLKIASMTSLLDDKRVSSLASVLESQSKRISKDGPPASFGEFFGQMMGTTGFTDMLGSINGVDDLSNLLKLSPALLPSMTTDNDKDAKDMRDFMSSVSTMLDASLDTESTSELEAAMKKISSGAYGLSPDEIATNISAEQEQSNPNSAGTPRSRSTAPAEDKDNSDDEWDAHDAPAASQRSTGSADSTGAQESDALNARQRKRRRQKAKLKRKRVARSRDASVRREDGRGSVEADSVEDKAYWSKPRDLTPEQLAESKRVLQSDPSLYKTLRPIAQLMEVSVSQLAITPEEVRDELSTDCVKKYMDRMTKSMAKLSGKHAQKTQGLISGGIEDMMDKLKQQLSAAQKKQQTGRRDKHGSGRRKAKPTASTTATAAAKSLPVAAPATVTPAAARSSQKS